MLEVVRELDKRIKAEIERLEWLKSTVSKCSSEIDGIPKSKGTASRVERLAVMIVDAEKLIGELETVREACAVELMQEIERRLSSHRVKRVMIERYCFCKSFSAIMRGAGYSASQVYRLHRIGLKKMAVEWQLNGS